MTDRLAAIRSRLMSGDLIAVKPTDPGSGASIAHTGASFAPSFPARTQIRRADDRPIGWPEAERWADFFAHAPADMAWLLGEIDALRSQNQSYWADLVACRAQIQQDMARRLAQKDEP